MWYKLSAIIGLVLLFFPSCTKTPPNNGIPYVYVNYDLYLSNPDNVMLQALGNWKYLNNQGSRGLLVYHKDLGEFMVYDRHCTYNPDGDCGQVSVMSDNVTLYDSCCGSKFLMYDGSIVNGPAQYPLKAYMVYYNNDILHITN
ncbi:MAG: hypothetical protein K1X82_02395 [Bacteroidia bacterium]|nr:hypothetical protein [Bacteroidia bacterium]